MSRSDIPCRIVSRLVTSLSVSTPADAVSHSSWPLPLARINYLISRAISTSSSQELSSHGLGHALCVLGFKFPSTVEHSLENCCLVEPVTVGPPLGSKCPALMDCVVHYRLVDRLIP
jgi:hypothetical protein